MAETTDELKLLICSVMFTNPCFFEFKIKFHIVIIFHIKIKIFIFETGRIGKFLLLKASRFFSFLSFIHVGLEESRYF